ncbi:MAG: hypothetical protein GC159_18870 [Phycisphaera sp.]|nr:hypothetical protein [Phycisphaera sp.]
MGLLCVLATLAACQSPPMKIDAPIDIGDPAGPTLDQVVNRKQPPPRDRPMGAVLDPVAVTYQMMESATDDPAAAKDVTVKVERSDDTGPCPWRRYTSDKRVEHLGIDASGSMVMNAVDDLAFNVTNWFDPPVPIFPSDLKPGEAKAYRSTIVVTGMGQPADAPSRDRGVYDVTLTLSPDRLVQTPAGWFICQHLQRDHTVKLGMASVKTTSEQWYAPGYGLVAENTSENVRALIVSWTKNRRLRLIDREPLEEAR